MFLILGHLAGGILSAVFAADRESGIIRNSLGVSAVS